MSTKIYQGFTFKKKGLDAFYRMLPTITETIRPLAEQMSFNKVINTAIHIYDMATVQGTPIKNGGAYYDAIECIGDELRESSKGHRRSPYDVGFSLCVGITQARKVIGIGYTDRIDLWSAFLNLPGISEYYYFDNTDRPEGMSLKRWEAREKDWNEVLGYEAPVNAMLSFEVMPEYVVPIPYRVMEFNPTPFGNRLRNVARNVTIKESKDIQFETPYDFMKYISESPEFAERLEANKKKFEPLLDKELTLEKLQGTK